jgi:phage baseplate assembly protein W
MPLNQKVRVSRSFKDISLSFEPHPVTKDIPILKNENAIKRSVRNLVETIITERFFNSTLGSNVRSTLFEFIDYASASVIQNQIETVLFNYEPRIENVQINVIPFIDENSFEVNVIFDIKGQDFPQQNFSFLLEAAR